MTKPSSPIWQSAHRLATGCLGFYGMIEEANPTDNSPNAHGGANHSATRVDTPGGRGWNIAAANNAYLDLGACLNPATLPGTLALRVKTPASALYGRVCYTSDDMAHGLWLEIRNSRTIWAGFGGGGYFAYKETANTVSPGTWYTITAVLASRSNIKVYVDGVEWGGMIFDYSGGGYTPGSGNSTLGRLLYGGSWYYSDLAYDCAGVWGEGWDADDVASFAADPWGLVRSNQPARVVGPMPNWSDFARERSQSAHPELWDGLQGLWMPSLGPTGGALFDVSAFRRHGTLVSNPASPQRDRWSVGARGWWNTFNGAGDYVQLAGTGDLVTSTAQPFTLAAWVNSAADASCFIAGSAIESSPWDGIAFAFGGAASPRRPHLSINAAGTSQGIKCQIDSPLALGMDYLIVATYDGSQSQEGIRLYVDGGVPAQTRSSNGSLGDSLPARPWRIGTDAYGSGTDFFNGCIGPCGIWSRVLAPQEIARLYAEFSHLLRPRPRHTSARLGAVGGPYCVTAAQTFRPGAATGGPFLTGARAGQTFHSGQVAGIVHG